MTKRTDADNPDPKSVPEILRMAKRLIEKQDGSNKHAWIKDHLAIDKYRDTMLPRDHRAVSWCALGAIRKMSPNAKLRNDATKLMDRICQARMPKHSIYEYDDGDVKGRNIIEFNDRERTRHNDIMKAFADAIQESLHKGN